MKNREYYKKQLLDIACSGSSVALIDGVPEECRPIKCIKCECNDKEGCHQDRVLKWSREEYEEPVDWDKVDTDTDVLVRNTTKDEWQQRKFAFCNRGTVYTFERGYSSQDGTKNVLWWNFAKLAK